MSDGLHLEDKNHHKSPSFLVLVANYILPDSSVTRQSAVSQFHLDQVPFLTKVSQFCEYDHSADSKHDVRHVQADCFPLLQRISDSELPPMCWASLGPGVSAATIAFFFYFLLVPSLLTPLNWLMFSLDFEMRPASNAKELESLPYAAQGASPARDRPEQRDYALPISLIVPKMEKLQESCKILDIQHLPNFLNPSFPVSSPSVLTIYLQVRYPLAYHE